MITSWLEQLSLFFYQSSPFAFVIAVVAGVLTAFTPCSLSTVPLVLAYFGGTSERSTRSTLTIVAFLTMGFVLFSTVLGVVIALTGRMLTIQWNMPYVYLVLGVLLVLMAVQTWGIWEIIPSTYLQSKVKRKDRVGAFLVGGLSAVFSSPCTTPVTVALLAGVSLRGDWLAGAGYLALYALGHAVVYPTVAFAAKGVKRLQRSPVMQKYVFSLNLVLGLLFFAFGTYLVSLFFTTRLL